jgi:hypothetical protein
MKTVYGRPFIYGIQDRKPIVNVPAGAQVVKIRMRSDDVATAFVKTHEGMEQWYLGPLDNDISSEYWVLDLKKAENFRPIS